MEQMLCAVCWSVAVNDPPIEREKPHPKNEYLLPCEVCGDPAQINSDPDQYRKRKL